jgi:outer membrane protein assembly factor BamB
MKQRAIIFVTCLILYALGASQETFAQNQLIANAKNNWPTAAGPDGSWATRGDNFPSSWSVATNKNIRWRTSLPEGGQSGIAVWNDHLFLTTNRPLSIETPNADAVGGEITGYCINANTGKVLWKVELPGDRIMQHTGLFSDASSPTPVTDGKYVWFVNASGMMGCYDFSGKTIWTREFVSRSRHNAKQCEPMLIGDALVYVQMRDKDDPKRRPMKAKPGQRNSAPELWPWTFIRAFDKNTGKPLWTADAATSIHNTPTVGYINDQPAIFHARGGGHRPPEMPYGFSLTSLAPANPGKTLWNRDTKSGIAYFVAHFDQQHAYCFDAGHLCSLDIKTGEETKRISITKNVDWYRYNEATNKYEAKRDTTFSPKGKKSRLHPTNQTNILLGDHCLFMSYAGHCIGRINVKTGKVEYVQVPVQVVWNSKNKTACDGPSNPNKQFLWSKHIPSDTQNSRGMSIAPDKRAKGDGWGHVTSAPPIAVNNHVIFTTMLGTVYVVNADAKTFDASAIVSVNDLGHAGKTWTLGSPAAAGGRLFFRTLKNVVYIEAQD